MKRTQLVVPILLIVLALSIGTQVLALPTVDGNYQSTEGYTHHWILASSNDDEGAAPMDLWLAQDAVSFDLYIAAILPKTYCDNTYGANSIGWKAKKDKPGHTFKDLLNSDNAQFVFDVDGNTVFDVKLDYLAEDATATSGYSCGGADEDMKKSDGEMKVGNIIDLLAARTSLDYNLNDLVGGSDYVPDPARAKEKGYEPDSPATDDNYTPNPDIPGWIFEIVYEFKIAGSVFGQAVLDAEGLADGFSMMLDELHASPHKKGEYKDTPVPPEPVPPITPIPEPATIILFGLAAAGTALAKKRRTRK